LRVLATAGALAAALLLPACAGTGAASRKDVEDLRAEVRALRAQNEELVHRVDALSGRLEVVTARLTRGAPARATEAPAAPLVPPDLEVVHVAPVRPAHTPPPVATTVPIGEPDLQRLDALIRPSERAVAAEAEAELRYAHKRSGLDRAHALEDFAARFPRHPAADNALVEAAQAYAEAGRDDAACALARRTAEDYPAGDAMSDALERLAWCESRRGTAEAERRLLQRLVSEYPRTPAAERAGKRLAAISGRGGENTPAVAPARSGP